MIKLQHVSKSFNSIKAVNNISFEVRQGETVVLLGTSGCGKTTTLRMINRLEKPSSGEVLVNGKNVKDQPLEALRRGIGYVLQHHGLFPHYTIEENIAIVPQLLKWHKEKTKNRVAEVMEKLQLPLTLLYQYPDQLSGGQQQRVGLARALAADPPILLMDEPLGALDPVTRSAIRQDFNRVDELKQKTILLVTHDVQEAFELADRICLMNKGEIVQIGSPSALLFKPASPFVSSFLKEQKLQLELETITVDDVWDLLPKSAAKVNQQEIDLHNNLWQSLEILSASTDATVTNYIINKNGEERMIDPAIIMQAYTSYKNRMVYG